MRNVKQAVAAAILAGSMALTFVGGASADGPTPSQPAPTGTVRFFVDGASAQTVHPYADLIFEKAKHMDVQIRPDNEWKYVPVRR